MIVILPSGGSVVGSADRNMSFMNTSLMQVFFSSNRPVAEGFSTNEVADLLYEGRLGGAPANAKQYYSWILVQRPALHLSSVYFD